MVDNNLNNLLNSNQDAVIASSIDMARMSADLEIIVENLKNLNKQLANKAEHKTLYNLVQEAGEEIISVYNQKIPEKEGASIISLSSNLNPILSNLPFTIDFLKDAKIKKFRSTLSKIYKELSKNTEILGVENYLYTKTSIENSIKNIESSFNDNTIINWSILFNELPSKQQQFIFETANKIKIIQKKLRYYELNLAIQELDIENFKLANEACNSEFKALNNVNNDLQNLIDSSERRTNIAEKKKYICETNLQNNISDFSNKIREKEVHIENLEKSLEENMSSYNHTLTDLQNIKEHNEKYCNITLKKLNDTLTSNKQVILDREHAIATLEDALNYTKEKITDLELGHKGNLEFLSQLKKELKETDKNCIEQIVTCQKELKEADKNCINKLNRASGEFELAFSTLVDESNQVKNSLVEINHDLNNTIQEIGNRYNKCSEELYQLQQACGKNKNLLLQGPVSKLKIAVEKTVAMLVCFLIWPIYLRDPEGYFWTLIKEHTGLTLERGWSGISRRWAAEATSSLILVLWIGFLGGLFYRQFILLPQLKSGPKNSMKVDQEQPVSSRKEKIKNFFRNLWRRSDIFGLDEKIDEITKISRGGSFKLEQISYSDFLIFSSIHSHRYYNNFNKFQIKELFKSIKISIKVKRKAKKKVIFDKIINYLGPIVFFIIIGFSYCPPNTNNFLRTINLNEPVVIYRQNLIQEFESKALNISETELKFETVLENKVKEAPTKTNKKVKKKRRKSKLVKYSDFIKNFETQNDEYDEYIELQNSSRKLPIKIKNNNRI